MWQLPSPIEINPLEGIEFPLVIRTLLARRGFTDSSKTSEFLSSEKLPNPYEHFKDLGIAVSRLQLACDRKEPIAICGDYDADGMTSTALIMNVLKSLNNKSFAFIPSREKEGYGLNKNMVKNIHSQGINLIITVDNGVNAKEALNYAHSLSIDVIITDHHKLPSPLPKCLALIHPEITPESSSYKSLAGVGIAYLLAKELKLKYTENDKCDIAMDLFCIGTVADMAPLKGANREWLKEGLQKLHLTKCEGLRALLLLINIEREKINTEDIGFQIAPRINAVGRLDEPSLILDLFSEQTPDKAFILARKCDHLNRRRKELCDGIEIEALALLESDQDAIDPFILLAQNHWHQGVIGIVATRIMQKYNRPTTLLTGQGDGLFRASVRGPEGFSIINALDSCSELLEKYGGHPAAGGFTIKAENISKLHIRLINFAKEFFGQNHHMPQLKPEAHLRFEEINFELCNFIDKLEPFGVGNPKPTFWTRCCEVVEYKLLKGKHLKLKLRQDDTLINCIQWNCTSRENLSKYVDIVYQINVNYWENISNIQLDIKGIRSHTERIEIQKANRRYVCELSDNSNLSIENDRGKRLHFQIVQSNSQAKVLPNDQHPYINQLISESMIGFGLQH